MPNNTDIATWAARRAAEEANKNNPKSSWNETNILFWQAGAALARYIQEHEQPPVDPDLVLARKMFSARHNRYPETVRLVEGGKYDDYDELKYYLIAIKYIREKGLPEL